MSVGAIPLSGSTPLQPGSDVGKTRTVEQTAGSGALSGATGPAPGAPPTASASAMMESLRSLMPDISGEKLQVTLLKVLTTIRDTMNESEKQKIEVDQQSKRAALEEKSRTIKDAEAKMQEAEKKREELSVWDKIKIAFQYIGAIVAFIGAAIAFAGSAVTGPAGVASGIMLIAAGVILLGLAADATYAAATTKDGKPGLGFVGEMHKAVLMGQGMSEEEATAEGAKADGIGRIVANSLAAALMLGAAIAGGIGAFQAGKAAAEMSMAAGKTAVQTTAQTTAQSGTQVGVQAAAGSSEGAAKVVSIGLSIGSSAASSTGDIITAIGQNEATYLEAGSKDLEAQSKQWQAVIENIEDMIDMSLARLKGVQQVMESNLDALTEAAQDTGRTYSRIGQGRI
ncbi:type III secretion system translocon subunit SctE [uncultured Methylobacterium sp.]|jgi:hypothetical protein|uniref:type III secretion system translocon subunit SctE n=1 Tax=uncultured Methylobacterium sp. TaxID=157278 RepID=UPI0026248EBF|nr:type III secretion system translocon subunit SctE [uncultured Methylobacterium sp.]